MRRCPPRRLVSLACVAIAARAAASSPDAEPLDLEWRVPAGCPTRAVVLGEIARLVGPSPGAPPRARVSARVEIFRGEDVRWHVRITTLGESGGERELEAASCQAVTEATVLVLALRINPNLVAPEGAPLSTAPTAATAPTAPTAPTASTAPAASPAPSDAAAGVPGAEGRLPKGEPAVRPSLASSAPAVSSEPEVPERTARPPPRFFAAALLLGSTGEMPSVDASPEIAAGYTGGRFRIELHGEAGFAQHANAPASTAGGAVHAAGAGARGCYAPIATRTAALFACLDGEVDGMWAKGYGIATPLDRSAAWVTLGAGATATLRLSPAFALRGDLQGLAPFARPRFVTADYTGAPTGLVHTPARLWGRLALGAEISFF